MEGRVWSALCVDLSEAHGPLAISVTCPVFLTEIRKHDNERDYTILFDYCFHSASRIGRRSVSELRSSLLLVITCTPFFDPPRQGLTLANKLNVPHTWASCTVASALR